MLIQTANPPDFTILDKKTDKEISIHFLQKRYASLCKYHVLLDSISGFGLINYYGTTLLLLVKHLQILVETGTGELLYMIT